MATNDICRAPAALKIHPGEGITPRSESFAQQVGKDSPQPDYCALDRVVQVTQAWITGPADRPIAIVERRAGWKNCLSNISEDWMERETLLCAGALDEAMCTG